MRKVAARSLADLAQGKQAQPLAVALGQGPDAALDIAELAAKLARSHHREKWSE
jgi:hypothetical protein